MIKLETKFNITQNQIKKCFDEFIAYDDTVKTSSKKVVK